jgi:predicted PolB exonuclease-like 3'-5' exonuclease
LTTEQQKAIDFFNKYNEESEQSQKIVEKQVDTFTKRTEKVFDKNFKGFEYNIGNKKFRFNVKDANDIRETQGDINNFIKKFLNKDNLMEDARGYHKSLFTAMNADSVANHFYEQGKADALKESIAKSKNVSMEPRKSHIENVNTSGLRVRVLEDDGPDFKFKIKQKQ